MKDAEGEGVKPTKTEDRANCQTHILRFKHSSVRIKTNKNYSHHIIILTGSKGTDKKSKQRRKSSTIDTSGSRNALMTGTLWAVDENSTL